MLIETASGPFVRSHVTNATDTSFPSKIPTRTEPTGDGVVSMGAGGSLAPNGVQVIPFGAGANNDTFDMRLLGWRRVKTGADGVYDVWVPFILAQWNVTLGAITGVLNGAIAVADRVADTMALVALMGTANVSVETVSPANDTPAHALVDIKGAEKIELVFDMTGATSGNCLVARL